jgi:hypothetical protein
MVGEYHHSHNIPQPCYSTDANFTTLIMSKGFNNNTQINVNKTLKEHKTGIKINNIHLFLRFITILHYFSFKMSLLTNSLNVYTRTELGHKQVLS